MAEANSDRGELPQRTYVRLRDLIIRGRIPPGQRVIEAEVALRFGVSRTPVRQALSRLEHEGYLIPLAMAKRIERVVAPLSADEVVELWGIIGALESVAVEIVVGEKPLGRERVAKELESINAKLESESRRRPRDPDVLFELQTHFHRHFFEAGAGPRLRTIYNRIRPQVERYEWVYGTQVDAQLSYSTGEHSRIIEGIRRGDRRQAKDAVEDHWRLAAVRTSGIIRMLQS